MLTELRVRDLAVIADARLELGHGLNVLTGETGAGKSMLIDALALLLGERAVTDLVRPGAARAVVEGAFDVGRTDAQGDGRTALDDALERLGIEAEDGRLVLKREVQAAGRSRAWINGSPVTVAVLAELGHHLVDMHGQHETQSLLRADAQRDILDAYAGATAAAADVAAAFDEGRRLTAERDALAARQAEARRRADYLRHVAEEIRTAAPKDGELESLDAEIRRLTHAGELGSTAAELGDLLDGDERAASATLGHADRLLVALEKIDAGGAAGWRDMLETATVNINELARAVRDYADGIELDPGRLAAAERRRDQLFVLDQKYGPGLERVRETGEEARRELDLLDTAGTELGVFETSIAAAAGRLREACRTLGAARRKAARRLGTAVSRQLAALGMPQGTMRVALDALDAPGRHGAESVAFLVALNPGLGERPLARAASGGELSRVMLAIKAELAREDAVPTLVFDEVDQGVGGHVAGRVADALAGVATAHQVLVITHLPQVAARAWHHLLVRKDTGSVAAATAVEALDGPGRVDEVARMLGGAGATARRHAEELLAGATGPA